MIEDSLLFLFCVVTLDCLVNKPKKLNGEYMRLKLLTTLVFGFSMLSGLLFASSEKNEEGKKIYELTCKSCHAARGEGAASLDGKHKHRVAPPMANVKKHYLKKYPERDDFINAVALWAAAPSQDKALLKRAIKHHGMMPAQSFEPDALKKVAAYIYDSDMGKAGCGGHGDKKHGEKGGKHGKHGKQCDHGDSGKAGSCGSEGKKGGGCCGSGHGEGKDKGSCSH